MVICTKIKDGEKVTGMFSLRVLTIIASLLVVVLGPVSSWAQQQSVDPSEIKRRIEENKPAQKKAEPKFDVAPDTPIAPDADEAANFILAAVVIEGATVFDPVIFAPFYEDLLATEITLKAIDKILAQITKHYRDSGYILSRAIARPQELDTGVLRIDVIEGYVDQVVFKGIDGKQDMFSAYVSRIKADRPLRLDTLERNVLLINDISGIKIDPKMLPADEDQGRYALVLNVDHSVLDGYGYLNNRGTPSVGRLQSWVSAGVNSVFGLRERFEVGFFTIPHQPQELLYYEATYTQPLGNDGLHLSLNASTSTLDAGSELRATEIESTSSGLILRGWYPIIRSAKQNLWVTGTLQYKNFRETSFDVTTIADRLRVARVRFNYWQSHHKGSTSISFEGSQGLNVLNATEDGSSNLSRNDGRSDFTKLNANITRQQGLFGNFGLQASISGQWSAQPLLSSEEFALGGTNYGRAYDFSEVTGDDGVAASLEFRYGKNVGMEWLNAFQLYSFYDIGSVWNKVSGEGKFRDSISSAGVGSRITITPNFRINLEVAKPLTRAVNTRDSTSTRYFFNVSASF